MYDNSKMTDTDHLRAMLHWVWRDKKTGRYMTSDHVSGDIGHSSDIHHPQIFVDEYRQGFHDPNDDASTISPAVVGRRRGRSPDWVKDQ